MDVLTSNITKTLAFKAATEVMFIAIRTTSPP